MIIDTCVYKKSIIKYSYLVLFYCIFVFENFYKGDVRCEHKMPI